MTAAAEARRNSHEARVGRQILAAIGPSHSTRALTIAAKMARRLRRPLALVSVVSPPTLFDFDVEQFALNPWQFEQQRAERLHELHAQIRALSAAGTPLTETPIGVLIGKTPATIAEAASAIDSSLLVMGIGPHAVRHRLFGEETTLMTARQLACPVLAVSDDAVDPPRHVVIGIDFSVESIHAAITALALLTAETQVHLVHAWKPIATPLPLSALRESDAAYARDAAERLREVRTLLGRTLTVHMEAHVREGPVVRELLQAARDAGADLIVSGMRGVGGLERLFMGSVSNALLRGASCSVLLVPEPDISTRCELSRALDGHFVDADATHWPGVLESFARRNHMRTATFEIDDHALGAQRQLSGYRLLGATYDERDGRASLMFADGGEGQSHLTHGIGGIQSIAVSGSATRDRALCIESDYGRAILTLLDP